MKKSVLMTGLLLCTATFLGCSAAETAAQSRTDLTAEHFRGLTADMKRNEVEDLIGQDDNNLSGKEDINVYSLADGTTAVLRYVDDTLAGVFIRGKDMFEESIFNKFDRNGNNGDYHTENGIVTEDENQTDTQNGSQTDTQNENQNDMQNENQSDMQNENQNDMQNPDILPEETNEMQETDNQ